MEDVEELSGLLAGLPALTMPTEVVNRIEGSLAALRTIDLTRPVTIDLTMSTDASLPRD